MNQFEAYQLFSALRAHFNGQYDYVKYRGKMKVSPQNLQMRRDNYQFARLAKCPDPKNLIISNLVANKDVWINTLFSEEGSDIYQSWKKRQESLTYTIMEELKELHEKFDENFITPSNVHPHLLHKFIRGKVSIDLMVILDDLVKFGKVWNKKMVGDPMWDQTYQTMIRYRPFLEYDRDKMRTMIVEKFNG